MTSQPTTTPRLHKRRTGLDRIVHALGYSVAGLRAAYRSESAFRQEVWMTVVLGPAAFWLGDDWVQISLLAGSALVVLMMELLNSAIEATVDHISLEPHPLAKQAKDLGSAAVLLSLLLCGGIWAGALWHHFATRS